MKNRIITILLLILVCCMFTSCAVLTLLLATTDISDKSQSDNSDTSENGLTTTNDEATNTNDTILEEKAVDSQYIEMINVIGMTEQEATDILKSLGFKYINVHRNSIATRSAPINDKSQYTVVQQNISEGSKITNTDSIELTCNLKTITINNNADFAELLSITNCTDNRTRDFAKKYNNEILEFNGCVSYMSGYSDNKYCFDVYLALGDYKDGIYERSVKFSIHNITFVGMYVNGSGTVSQGMNFTFYCKIKGYDNNENYISLFPIAMIYRIEDPIKTLDSKIPIEYARDALTVAMTNCWASDVYTSNGKAYDPAKFHNILYSGDERMNMAVDGTWSAKDENTWHVENIYFYKPTKDFYVKVSCDITYDGIYYWISNVKCKYASSKYIDSNDSSKYGTCEYNNTEINPFLRVANEFVK